MVSLGKFLVFLDVLKSAWPVSVVNQAVSVLTETVHFFKLVFTISLGYGLFCAVFLVNLVSETSTDLSLIGR